MPFLSHKGVEATDVWTNLGRVILAHPSVSHALVLFCVQSEDGYQPAVDGWQVSGGRSITGGVRIAGGYRPPREELQCSFLCSCEQVQLFDWLKRAQDNSSNPITVQDWVQKVVQPPGAPPPNWLPGWPVSNSIGIAEGFQSFNAWVDTDRGYKTPVSGTQWWSLQFQAMRL
jgi:hypothetical protein